MGGRSRGLSRSRSNELTMLELLKLLLLLLSKLRWNDSSVSSSSWRSHLWRTTLVGSWGVRSLTVVMRVSGLVVEALAVVVLLSRSSLRMRRVRCCFLDDGVGSVREVVSLLGDGVEMVVESTDLLGETVVLDVELRRK